MNMKELTLAGSYVGNVADVVHGPDGLSPNSQIVIEVTVLRDERKIVQSVAGIDRIHGPVMFTRSGHNTASGTIIWSGWFAKKWGAGK